MRPLTIAAVVPVPAVAAAYPPTTARQSRRAVNGVQSLTA